MTHELTSAELLQSIQKIVENVIEKSNGELRVELKSEIQNAMHELRTEILEAIMDFSNEMDRSMVKKEYLDGRFDEFARDFRLQLR